MIKFTKMHGAGNDYIYINCFEENINKIKDLKQFIIKVSKRHFGIGSDGVILICPSKVADAKMIMYNADGSEGEMCGNGIRCVGKYVYDNNISYNNPLTIETKAGIKTLDLEIENNKVLYLSVNMGKPILESNKIPVITEKDKYINEEIKILDKKYKVTCVSMGCPHAVVFVDDVKILDLNKIGPLFENNELFPQRINTDFINIKENKEIDFRVWERGSGETLACGTGACASVVAGVINNKLEYNKEYCVNTLGGKLYITYKDSQDIILKGPAETIYTGEIDDE